MQIFNDFQAALEEAKYCSESERIKYYLFMRNGKYVVRRKWSGCRLKGQHIEVGCTGYTRGKYVRKET